MSETAATLPTVRLLEPRALVAADRAAARIQDRSAFLLRSIDGGALGFASRMFNYWFGATSGERAPMRAAMRGPAALQFARPWYELPSTWPARGIVVGGKRPVVVPGVAPRPASEEPRALELVSSYDAPFEHEPRGIAPQGGAPQITAPRLERPFIGAPVGIAARLAQQWARTEQMLRPAARIDAPVREGAREVATADAPLRVLPPFARVLVEGAHHEPVGVRASQPASMPPIALGKAPQGLPLAWPRVQRFVEQLAGPSLLAQAGQLSPLGIPELPATPAAALAGETARAPFIRELIAPTTAATVQRTRGGVLGAVDAPLGVSVAQALPQHLAPAATFAGELARLSPPPALGLPGRVAQHAELLASVAEQRVARQLGQPLPQWPRSVRWSADAFTVLALADVARSEAAHTLDDTRPRPAQPFLRSGASLAFADAQLGSQFLASTRPRPITMPVYLAAADVNERPAAGRDTQVVPPARLREPFAPVRLSPQLDASPLSTASALPSLGFAVGQLAVHSEQLAGSVGVRVASLSTEFLFDAESEAASASPAPAQRAWLSREDWGLLSVFPSAATVREIAQHAGQPAARSSRNALALPTLAASTRAYDQLATTRPLEVAAGDNSAIGAGIAATGNAARASEAPVAAPHLTLVLPDGRRPRGNRMATRSPHASTRPPVPMSLLASAEAAERRAEMPVGAPLWGHLRPVAPAVRDEPSASSTALPPALAHSRAPALELLAPYLEAAPAAQRGSSSFAQNSSPPPVSSRPSDDSTRSLVAALQSSLQSSRGPGDRLSMADMTLISIVAASEQVAAVRGNAAPTAASVAPATKSTANGAGGAQAQNSDIDDEIEIVAERAFRRLLVELRQYMDNKGEPWET